MRQTFAQFLLVCYYTSKNCYISFDPDENENAPLAIFSRFYISFPHLSKNAVRGKVVFESLTKSPTQGFLCY